MNDIPTDLVPLPTQPWEVRPSEIPLEIEEVRTAIWVNRGNVSNAAKQLRTDAARLRKFIKNSPRLVAEMEEASERLVDMSEDIVYDALTDGENPLRQDQMARYVLSSQKGRKRGWGNGQGGKVNINNNGGNVIVSWADGSNISDEEEEVDGQVIDHE